MIARAFLDWQHALGAVDRWKFDHLTPKQLAVLESRPAGDWPTLLFAMAPMIGDDLAPDPETRLLMVRLAVAARDMKQLQLLSQDSTPMVRRAAYRGAKEMAGDRPAQSHHIALAESIRWELARKRGTAKVPSFLTAPHLPPLQGS